MCELRGIRKDSLDQPIRPTALTTGDRVSPAVYRRRGRTPTQPYVGQFVALLALTPQRSYAQPPSTMIRPPALTESSLEDLMNITSVSKKEQPLAQVAAAVYVAAKDDIRHSGMTDVPDLLRMVPGVEVARITANAWAISIRGLNYRYSGKVRVVVDGHPFYNPFSSGVFGDHEPMRRNGVISVITKSYQLGKLASGPVLGYTWVDTRLGWRIGRSVEVSVGDQSLLTPRHLEFIDAGQFVPKLVGRSGAAKITWRFRMSLS